MSFTLAMDGGKAHTSEIDGAAVWKLLWQSMGLIGGIDYYWRLGRDDRCSGEALEYEE